MWLNIFIAYPYKHAVSIIAIAPKITLEVKINNLKSYFY